MSPPTLTAIVHAGVVVAGIAGYVILAATGHDGAPVLAAALAWAGGATVDRAIASSSSTDASTLTPPRR